jgi:hypothetical protein
LFDVSKDVDRKKTYLTIGARGVVPCPFVASPAAGFPNALLWPVDPNALVVVGAPNAEDPNALVGVVVFPNAEVVAPDEPPAPNDVFPNAEEPNADVDGAEAPNADVVAGCVGFPNADVVVSAAELPNADVVEGCAEFPNAEEPNGDAALLAPNALVEEGTTDPNVEDEEGAPNADVDVDEAGNDAPNADVIGGRFVVFDPPKELDPKGEDWFIPPPPPPNDDAVFPAPEPNVVELPNAPPPPVPGVPKAGWPNDDPPDGVDGTPNALLDGEAPNALPDDGAPNAEVCAGAPNADPLDVDVIGAPVPNADGLVPNALAPNALDPNPPDGEEDGWPNVEVPKDVGWEAPKLENADEPNPAPVEVEGWLAAAPPHDEAVAVGGKRVSLNCETPILVDGGRWTHCQTQSCQMQFQRFPADVHYDMNHRICKRCWVG